jgi:Ca2+-binding RTX toxin-like protein
MTDFAAGFALVRRPIGDLVGPGLSEMRSPTDTESMVRGGSLYTWVAGSGDAGIQLVRYGLGDTSDFQGFGFRLGAITDEDVGGLVGVRELETVTLGQNTFLLSMANPGGNTANSSVLSCFAIGPDLSTPTAGLTKLSQVATGGSLIEANDFLALKVGPKAFVVTWTISADGQTDHGALGVHQIRGDGSLTETTTLTKVANPDAPLAGIIDAEAVMFQGRTLVVTAANNADGLGLWVLDSAGQLTLLDSAKPYLDQSAPSTGANLTAVHIATVGDRTFAFAADTTSSRVITYEVVDDALVYRSDTSFAAQFNWQRMFEIKSFVSGGHLFLVTSQNGQLALMVVGPDGELTLAATASSSLTSGFANGPNPSDGSTVANAQMSGVMGFDLVEDGKRLFASTISYSQDVLNILGVGEKRFLKEVFEGTAADDRFFGLTSSMDAFGKAGDDQVFGGGGRTTAWGDTGSDSLYGGSYKDNLYGGSGSDTILGGNGNDLLNGWKMLIDAGGELDGGDSIDGGAGADTISGGQGNDTLYGGISGDVIDGGTHDDHIDGGTGNDLIVSSSGNDTITGGEGSDDFVFATNQKNNHDQITDFEIGADQIKLKGPDLNTFAEVSGAMIQSGSDTILTLRPGHTVTLLGIQMADLTAADFLFDEQVLSTL